jgi:DNA-binding GntR family transcriptional regulator
MSVRTGRESAAERVYRWLRERILDGTLAGGRLLSEGEVADAVQVSRTPVREAFLQLAAEGMLELFPKRGALVVSVTAAQLREVLVARMLIEPWASREAAARADRAGIAQRLRRLTAKASRALDRQDVRGFQDADRDFHEQVLAASGNELLAGFYASLRDRQLRAGTLAVYNDPARAATITAQHDAIVDAIERGDGDAAATAMAEHLNGTALALGLAPLR